MAASHGHQQVALGFSSFAPNTSSYSNSAPSQLMMQQTIQPQPKATGSPCDDLYIDPDDIDTIKKEAAYVTSFQYACEHGPLSTVHSIVSMGTPPPPRTRFFLYQGLIATLSAGNIDIARYLLFIGAPILRGTPGNILLAPSDKQLPLFELLLRHGWTTNTPGFYGALLLPRVVENLPLLQWFLLHGADPNLGEQSPCRDRNGGPDTNSCAALEAAASRGNVTAVRMLLDAGAQIQYGFPLHFAAAACLPGTNPYNGRVTPSKEFDEGRVPVMAILVERGADVNQAQQSRHVMPRYAIMRAVMAGAVERVRWLLEQGADPEVEDVYGSAVTIAKRMGSEEMRHVITSVYSRPAFSTIEH